MKNCLFIISALVMAVGCFAADTNITMEIRVSNGASGWSKSLPIHGWSVKSISNQQYIVMHQIQADEIVCSSNSLTIGTQTISESDGGIKIKKLVLDSGPDNPGKQKIKKSDIQIADAGFGVHYVSTNGFGQTKGWLHWVDYDGQPQTVQITASPEIPFEERLQKMRDKSRRRKLTKNNWNGNGQLQERIEKLEQLMGLRELDD